MTATLPRKSRKRNRKATRERNRGMLRERRQRVLDRIENCPGPERDQPMMTAANIHYELADRVHGLSAGGLSAMHLLARRTGLIRDIDANVHVLKRHLPYHESDHVLNIAYNIIAGGVLAPLKNWHRNPFTHRPNVIGKSRCHGRCPRSDSPLLVTFGERSNRPAEVITVHGEIGHRLVHTPVLRERVRLADLSGVVVSVRRVLPLEERSIDPPAHLRLRQYRFDGRHGAEDHAPESTVRSQTADYGSAPVGLRRTSVDYTNGTSLSENRYIARLYAGFRGRYHYYYVNEHGYKRLENTCSIAKKTTVNIHMAFGSAARLVP